MRDKIKKIIIASILLITLIVIGLFFVGKKTASSGIKKQQPLADSVANKQVSYPIKIMFVGDMMFDRYISQVFTRRGDNFSFRNVDALLKDNDLVVGNLEGPITDKPSISTDSVIGSKENYVFTFDPKFADILKKENISLVNIGNNHISNFGSDGVASTRKYLDSSNVGYFGDPEIEDGRLKIENIKGLKIAFVNYDQFVTGAEQKTLADIEKAKSLKTDLIILYTHWGTEFVPQANQKIKDLAHEFVDAGADLIIGSHPHVVQQKEEYKGREIYYSLGNFIFDQYFSPETQKGLAVQVEIGSDKQMKFKNYSIKMDSSGQTSQTN